VNGAARAIAERISRKIPIARGSWRLREIRDNVGESKAGVHVIEPAIVAQARNVITKTAMKRKARWGTRESGVVAMNNTYRELKDKRHACKAQKTSQ
jgi:hypothetical protein